MKPNVSEFCAHEINVMQEVGIPLPTLIDYHRTIISSVMVKICTQNQIRKLCKEKNH